MFFVILGINLVALLRLNIESELFSFSLATSMYHSPVCLASKREELVISVLTTESWMQLLLHADALPPIETILAFLHGVKWIFDLSPKVATGSSKLILVIVKKLHFLFPQRACICSKSLVLVSIIGCHYLIGQLGWPWVIFFEEGVLRSRIISWGKKFVRL